MPGYPRAQHPHCTPQARNPGKEKRWIFSTEPQHSYRKTSLALFFSSQVARFHRIVKGNKQQQQQQKYHILPTDPHTNNGDDVCHCLKMAQTLNWKGYCPFVSISLVDSLLGTSWYSEFQLISQIKLPWQGKGQEMITFCLSTLSAALSQFGCWRTRNVGLAIMRLEIVTEIHLVGNLW